MLSVSLLGLAPAIGQWGTGWAIVPPGRDGEFRRGTRHLSGMVRALSLVGQAKGGHPGRMTEIVHPTSHQPAEVSRPVLETTVGGVLREAARRAADTVALVEGVPEPDAHWGEQVAAFVRPAPGQSPSQEELITYCRHHLAAHKTPRHWVFVEAFPLTPSGKVQKFVLRERYTSGEM